MFVAFSGEFQGFGKTFVGVAEVARDDVVVQVFPVVFEVIGFPVFVHIFPAEVVEDVEMGFEHVCGHGIAEFLIAVVEGDAEAVFGEVG